MRSMISLRFCFGVLFSSLLAAQAADPQATLVAEAKRELNDYAKESFASGYVDRAEEIWREVLAEYDTDDEAARKALGFKKVGTAWAMDPEFRYPEWGQTSLDKAKALRKRWDKTAADLAKAHLACAEALAAAGNSERANYHFDRVLRFQPGEAKAAAARGAAAFDGMFGTATEIALLKRARVVRRAVAQAQALEVKVAPATVMHEAIKRSGLQMAAFAGPNVTCYGDVEPAVVQEAVRIAERSLALCKAVFEGFASYRGDKLANFQCFCKDDASWLKVLEANLDMIGASSPEFLREHKPSTTLTHGTTRLGFMRAMSPPTAYDMAARWIAQSFASFSCDALHEGIGHTLVGLLLGQNYSYSIGEDKESGTVASRTRKLKLETPDMLVWQELAVDTAWENTSVPAAQLAFLKAASFPTEGRIKAWSFCHFLLLRDPELIRKLDQCPGENVRNPPELREKFMQTAGISIDALDLEWRSFWTKDTPLLRSLRGGETAGLEAVNEEAFAWIDAINAQRKALNNMVDGLGLEPVHWSESYSEDCKLHVDYLEKHKSERGLGKEDSQDLNKDGGSLRGRQFAQSAIVAVGATRPDKAMETWMLWPGYRHVLLDPRLQVVGAFANKNILVMDVTRGVVPDEKGRARLYPFGNMTGIPHEVDVAELGPDVRKFLDAHGGKGAKKVGFPLTRHGFGRTDGTMSPAPNHYKCELLLLGKDPVPGVLHLPEGQGSRRASARTLAVFYPLQPLKRGTLYTYAWTEGDKKDDKPNQFTTK
jgi:hypothetical protein